MDCSPPGSSVHGISQARILEWFAISFSRWSSDPGIEPISPASSGGCFYHWATWETLYRSTSFISWLIVHHVPETSNTSPFLRLFSSIEVGIITSVLQMNDLRLREAKRCASGHTVVKRQSQFFSSTSAWLQSHSLWCLMQFKCSLILSPKCVLILSNSLHIPEHIQAGPASSFNWQSAIASNWSPCFCFCLSPMCFPEGSKEMILKGKLV